ncbi:MAG: HAD family hydrolase [Chloroflexota bacterium]
MIKAVFFDLYQTLINYNPPREEQLARIISDYGIEVTADALRRPMVIADEFIYEENSRLPISKRNKEGQNTLFTEYQAILLKEAGINPTPELILNNMVKMQQIKFNRVLFDDVLPALKQLKQNGIILGLISNIDSDIAPLFDKLELAPLLKVAVTSRDSGYYKPQPEIFKEAARQAGVKAEESMYIGDQYQIDVLGAKEARMQGVLLDRNGYFNEDTEELIIKDLYQLVDYLLSERG